MKVAFLGLGNMGSGIANNILRAGFDLTVWNRTPEKMQAFIDAGAHGSESPRDAVDGADVVCTSLMDDESIRVNLDGANGILAGMKPRSVHVCLTTISPAFCDELAAIHERHGSYFVAGPVVGRPDATADGTLMSFIAGSPAGIELATPVCAAYTETLIPIGPRPGVAAAMKLCLNYTVISIIEMMSEVYAYAEKTGVDLALLQSIYESAFAHPALKMYAAKIPARAFDDGGFSMTGGLKDVRLMLDSATASGADFEIGRIVERKMLDALAQDMARKDWSAIYEISRQQAGLA